MEKTETFGIVNVRKFLTKRSGFIKEDSDNTKINKNTVIEEAKLWEQRRSVLWM